MLRDVGLEDISDGRLYRENDMVKTEIRSNNLDQNQDEIWDYRNCFENYKNCAHYVDEDQNGICDYCLNHEDLADLQTDFMTIFPLFCQNNITHSLQVI